jgi:RNA polymerase sigma-70 factor (family 1)
LLVKRIAILSSSNHTCNQLWRAIQAGDHEAFEQLYQTTVIHLTNQAYSILKDRDLVKDILQDVFVSLYTKRNELPADMNVMGYLNNAVKYKVSTVMRDRLSRENHHLSILKTEEGSFLQSFPYENTELKKQIRAGIDTLPEKCRQAFMLNHYGSLGYKAIALEMGISVKTVEKHISKALQVLRKELSEEKYTCIIMAMLALLHAS